MRHFALPLGRPGTKVTWVLVLLAAFTLIGTAAWAYWSTTGHGTASASTGTLNPPTGVTANYTTGANSVGLVWVAPTGTPSAQSYYVVRTKTSDNSTAQACGTDTTTRTTSTSCTDTAVPDGTYTYAVTAVYNSWTATSVSSNAVSVLNDTTAPTVPAPVATAAVSFGSNPKFVTHEAVTLTDAATDAGTGVASVSYYYCAGSTGGCTSSTGTFIGTSTVASGIYSVTTNAFTSAPDGPYRIVAVGVDNAGNTSAASALTLLTVDTTPPTVSRPTVNGHS